MGVIWSLSSSSDTPGPPLVHPLDWIAHFTAYFALAYALGRATGRRDVALLIAVWWGALDEVHQSFVPGRDAGVTDWLFDLAGAWMGSALAQRRNRVGRDGGEESGLSQTHLEHQTH
ncbi:VanZ family protein [Deinococcus sp. ZS9-10]|uniref:VanZ family protein n=2 Tax=Deinococcus arenicola TaxID=2994950 RepID=A0ABU4DN33_9DEIO|nr:VanZ family protein [Deinococcus sp. ZS9-10]